MIDIANMRYPWQGLRLKNNYITLVMSADETMNTYYRWRVNPRVVCNDIRSTILLSLSINNCRYNVY